MPEQMKVGDRLTIDVLVYRRWWQFWRPRIVGMKPEQYVIVSTHTGSRWPMRVI